VYGIAASGLLNGRKVTTHWRFARDLAQRYPRLKVDHRKPFVQDGPYLAQSVEQELTLRLTKEDQEDVPANSIAEHNHPINRFSELVGWLIRNLDADLSVEVLARRACMCPSHFSKVFKSILGQPPRDFVLNLRLNEARRRLSKRQKTLRTVSESVGFRTSLAFQEAFERKFGARPSTYLQYEKPLKLAMANG
ncbi:MAG: hypothetical protein QOF72_450, partial [Blastocatellia bacterium]|nr:hypothetical protein [Blastocatellia bacterium]